MNSARRTAAIRKRGATSALLAGLVALGGCEGGGTGGPPPAPALDCAALSDSLFPESARTGVAVFKVVAPNGGSFRIGSEMRVVVSGADFTSAVVDLVVTGRGVVRVPGFPANGSIDLRDRCEFVFAVPESATTSQNRRVSLVSDSVKVRVSDYIDATASDFSDSAFAIVR